MKMREQRWLGLVMVVISWLLLTIAAGGETLEERDATAVLLTLPLGLYMMFGETLVLHHSLGELHATQLAHTCLVLAPCAAGQVAADDHLELQSLATVSHSDHRIGHGDLPVG